MSTAVFSFPASQYGVEAGLVADRLSKLKEGEQISYQDLSVSAGMDVLKFRNILNSARRVLRRDRQMVFKPVYGEGLVRLDNEQIASTGIESAKRIGRIARRSIKTVHCADYDKLSPAGKTRHTVGLTILNMMQHSSGGSTVKKLETVVSQGAAKVLPLKQSLLSMLSE